MTRRRAPGWLKAAMAAFAVFAVAAGALAVYFNRPPAGPPPPTMNAGKDRAYKAFSDRVDGYRACRADADCVRVKADCACTAVAKVRLADFEADYAKTVADAGLASCVDWPEPSCEAATSSPVCVHGACRVHVVIEDAAWDQ
ncbi:hypothetical protein EPO15_17785 [bacterium]|nr:MAG: hypothetical protein EPO15_17785 [bacterium]